MSRRDRGDREEQRNKEIFARSGGNERDELVTTWATIWVKPETQNRPITIRKIIKASELSGNLLESRI